MIVGDDMDLTKIYGGEEFKEAYVRAIVKEVMLLLEERGYDPINQLVGYLMSGDPGYITNYKDARGKITSIERSRILEVLVKEMKESA